MKHSLYRDSLNKEALKASALKIAGKAKHYTECHLAIEYLINALREYGDHHSFFMKAAEVTNWSTAGSSVSKVEFPTQKLIENYGYIKVPPFHGGNGSMMLAYADSLQASVRKLDQQNVKGWIIDLRENTGGNMAPMIAGLGPLFSSSKLGSLVDVNGKSHSWYYENGRYYMDDEKGWNVSSPVTIRKGSPIAVLISNKVGSSGEIVVISFIGNEKTKFFGQPTYGLTTGNGSFTLKDGSMMLLASTIMADRNGKQYHSSIHPDELIQNQTANGVDLSIQAALKWLGSF
jgi:C-terminal processing protease CtpA/Prc